MITPLNESPAPYAKLIVAGGDCGMGGLIEVSLIVTLLLVATTVLSTFLIETVKVSLPSVKESVLVVTLNDPIPSLTVKDPEIAAKSALVVVV
jgi:hypothetical protein